MNTQKTIIKPHRKALHNPRATAAAPCSCPACVCLRTAEGRRRVADWNKYARSKTRVFSVVLTGNALAPRFHHGDALAINRDILPLPGRAVLVRFNGNPKRCDVMILNGDGDLTDLGGGWVPRGNFSIVGAVVRRHAVRRVYGGPYAGSSINSDQRGEMRKQKESK